MEKSLETAKENPKKETSLREKRSSHNESVQESEVSPTEMAKMVALQLPVETGQSKPRQPEKPEEPSFKSAQPRPGAR